MAVESRERTVSMAITRTRSTQVQPTPLLGNTATWPIVLALIPLGAAITVYLRYSLNYIGVDFDVYHGGAKTLLAGSPLYDFFTAQQLPFTYPPVAAIAFAPLALFPVAVAAAGWTFFSVLAMEVLIWLILGQIGTTGPTARSRWTVVATVLALPLGPVGFNLWMVQINILLMLLIWADLFRRTGRFRGVGIGIAAGIKLIPLIFVLYLLFTRRFREALTALATFAGTVLLGFLLIPKDSVQYWFHTVAEVDRITLNGRILYFDTSLNGLLGRLNVPDPTLTYIVLGGVVGALGLALSVWASRRGRELVGVMSCGITSLLVSPVSWVTHWMWIIPLLMMWAARAWRGRLVAEMFGVVVLWSGCVASCYWVVLIMLESPVPEAMPRIFPHMYLAIGVGTLIVFALYLRRTARFETSHSIDR
jgi:alpha-1,2-mannosyltransferase